MRNQSDGSLSMLKIFSFYAYLFIFCCRYRTAVLDESIVGLMAAHYRVSRQVQAEQILKWDYDHMTATYFLLLARKQVGKQYQHLLSGHVDPLPDLVAPAAAAATAKRPALSDQTGTIANSPRGLHTSLEGGLDNLALLNIGTPPTAAIEGSGDENKEAPAATFERTGNKNRASERYHIPHKKAVKDQLKTDDKENFLTPVGTPRRSTKKVGQENQNVLSPSKSLDHGMNVLGTPVTPTGRPTSGGQTTPSKSGKKEFFGSIERGLDKMKNMLTPRKRLNSVDGPVTVTGKGLCNVSTTSHHNPDSVLTELTRALVYKGVAVQQKGYILRGKISDPSGLAKLSFELEVVRIPNLNVVGIRRKRLKGDAWCYKKVCEEVLRMTAAGGHNRS